MFNKTWKITDKSLNDLVEIAKNVAELKAERDKYKELYEVQKKEKEILLNKLGFEKGLKERKEK